MGKRHFCFFFCVLFLFAGWISGWLYAFAGSDSWLYAGKQDKSPSVLNAEDLFVFPAGETFSAGESAYLRETGYTLSYTDALPAGNVRCTETDTGLTVRASAYSYTAQNGETVTWTPTAVFADGVQAATLFGAGSVTLPGLTADCSHEIRVEYETRIFLSGETLNRALDALLSAATRLQTEEKTYTDARNAWEQGNADYAAALASYEKAVTACAGYAEALAEYNAYRTAADAYAQYTNDCAAYNDAYTAYLAKMAIFTPEWKAYLQYETEMDRVRGILYALDALLTSQNQAILTDCNTPLSAAAAVLKNAGVSGADLQQFSDSSAALSALLGDADLTGEAERLAFAVANGSALLSDCSLAFSSLSRILKTSAAVDYLMRAGCLDPYINLCAALYAVSAYTDDTVTFNGQTAVANTTVTALLSPISFPPDTNGFAALSPVLPEAVEKPVKPIEPTAPTPVEDPALRWETPPAEPTPVETPVKPSAADYYSTEPVAPRLTESENLLLSDLRAGLVKSHSRQEDRILTLHASLTKTIVTSATPRTFSVTWRYNGGEKTTKVTEGTIPQPPLTPADYGDETAVCRFVGWEPAIEAVTEDGTVFTARYETHLLAPLDGGERGAAVEKITGYFRVTLPTDCKSVELSALIAAAEEAGRGLRFLCGDAKLTVPANAVADLADCAFLSFYPDSDGYYIAFSDTGKRSDGDITVSLPVGTRTASVALNGERLTSRRESPFISASFAGNGLYNRQDACTVAAETSAGGKVTVDGKTHYPGDCVAVTAKPEKGYMLASLTYTYENDTGTLCTLPLADTFIQPQADVTVTAVFTPLLYTVTFADETGTALSRVQYTYGETPVPPDAPEKQGYRFLSWLPVPEPVTADILYTPLYEQISGGSPSVSADNPASDDSLSVLWFGILGVFLLAGCGALCVFLLRRTRRK